MKSIKTYLNGNQTKEICNALENAGFNCISFSKCELEHVMNIYPYVDSPTKVKLEIVSEDDQVGTIVNILMQNECGSKDCIIFISPADKKHYVDNLSVFWYEI